MSNKSVIVLDGTTESTKTFIINDENHTFGNALQSIICRYPDVDFCGYSLTHPSDNKVNLRIQANNNKKAVDIFRRGLNDLDQLCDEVLNQFKSNLP